MTRSMVTGGWPPVQGCRGFVSPGSSAPYERQWDLGEALSPLRVHVFSEAKTVRLSSCGPITMAAFPTAGCRA